jgi:hypothetical protein
VKPDDNEERSSKDNELRVPAFTPATISDKGALEHPSSEQKMRVVCRRLGRSIRLAADSFGWSLEGQVPNRTMALPLPIQTAF